MTSVIEVKDLYRSFGEIEAVRGISFEVSQGETFGFLGPNGAGKTTTIKILVTLLAPSAGDAWVGGYHVSRSAMEVRRCLGIVFQDPSLDEKLTAVENLRFHAQAYHLPKQIWEERISAVLSLVGLEERRKDLVHTFSGGMKRRLEIARGILHHPRILFLDEPTLGLDPQTRRKIWEYVKMLKETQGVTIFMTTHYMEEAEHCDRIAIIDHGKLVILGAPDELKKKVGGDVVTIETDREDLAEAELRERFSIQAKRMDGTLQFEIQDGEKFLPAFIQGFGQTLKSVSVRKPTLEDLFVMLTGREIRPSAGEDLYRSAARLRGTR